MSNIQVAPATIFSFQAQNIRTFAHDGEPWFVAADVAQALGYRNASDLTRSLEDYEKGTHIVRTPGGDQEMSVINESGLYSAVLKSRKPEAKVFKRWVTCEVLPAIRKTGEYRTTITPEQQRAIQEAVAAKVAREGVAFQTVYQALKSRFRIPRYDLLPQGDFAECLAWLGAQKIDDARKRQVAAVALMERGLHQHREHRELVRSLWSRVADLGDVARCVAEELEAMRAVLQVLDKSGAIFDGLHEAQAHLGFPREVLDEGRALAEQRLPKRWCV